MLTGAEQNTKTKSGHKKQQNAKRNVRRERKLWHEPEIAIGSLGCAACPDFRVCGGLKLRTAFFDCLQFCCGKPDECDRVCRNHPEFADRVREVGTFDLDTVPHAPVLTAPALPRIVPIIYDRTSRRQPLPLDAVALPLYSMFDRRSGMPRHTSHAALCEAFVVRPGSTLVLTGTDEDAPLERWWELGAARRQPIIQSMKAAGIGLVTTPNFSLFLDRPRWDDLHAMKRIATIHSEFLNEGLPAALHVNGRTDMDFRRWTDYVASRPEITHVAYEFTTGTARRPERHAKWLAELATTVNRPLHLVVRGGLKALPVLAGKFASVTLLDTSIYMKTIMRQRAFPKSNSALGWASAPTERGAPIDDLFEDNFRAKEAWAGDLAVFSYGAHP
ncbi:DUF4417 domain-containing protein [Azospirillum agricola]|uniref:DUF4417 domain-containing protein n=1 Tax=Azospirillum agricola TaxID=1720247 RepID=UPI000A0EEF16|nr:DUF4417 domain-containing protein [Azospirillum agricola]SMH62822.1 protein of unknown function [Azospirillum lipoferum]